MTAPGNGTEQLYTIKLRYLKKGERSFDRWGRTLEEVLDDADNALRQQRVRSVEIWKEGLENS